MTTRTKTEAALCAAAIRKDLKQAYPLTKFRVISKNYSMGDHVDVKWTDGPRQDEVQKLLGKYQYGHFDGMNDIYENTNCRDDIPQTKYLFCDREASRERRQAAIDWVNKNIDVEIPLYIDEWGGVSGRLPQDWGKFASELIHQMLSGYYTTMNPEMDFSDGGRR